MRYIPIATTLLCFSCASPARTALDEPGAAVEIVMESTMASSGVDGGIPTTYGGPVFYTTEEDGWIEFEVEFRHSGLYRTELVEILAQRLVKIGAQGPTREQPATLWIERMIPGTDGRTAPVAGPFAVHSRIGVSGGARTLPTFRLDGASIEKGTHRMRLHFDCHEIVLKAIRFTPQPAPDAL